MGPRCRPSDGKLTTPTLMVHADNAASGADIPRRMFERIGGSKKELAGLASVCSFSSTKSPRRSIWLRPKSLVGSAADESDRPPRGYRLRVTGLAYLATWTSVLHHRRVQQG